MLLFNLVFLLGFVTHNMQIFQRFRGIFLTMVICEFESKCFVDGTQEIDGEALLCLSQNDLVEILHMKLGPAIKIQNALLLLKEKMQKGFTTES